MLYVIFNTLFSVTIMKVLIASVMALACVLGLAAAMGYGGYGYGGGYGGGNGGGNGSCKYSLKVFISPLYGSHIYPQFLYAIIFTYSYYNESR